MSATTWHEYVNGLTVQCLMVEGFELIQLSGDTTVPEAIKLLTEKQIQACPVWDDSQRKYVGMIDLLDLVTLIVLMSDAKQLVDIFSHQQVTWDQYLAHENHILANQKISEVCDFSERNPWCPVWDGTPLNSLLDMFGVAGGLHRVPVVDENGKVVGFVTQTTVLRFLAAYLPMYFPTLLVKSIDNFSIGSSNIAKVQADATVFDAFHMLIDRSVSGLAVIENGKLYGCISASDLRGSKDIELFTNLRLKVGEFIDSSTARGNITHPLHPIVVTPDDTVATMLTKILNHHIHRVFLLDDKGAPKAVISLGDVLSLLQFQE